MRFHDALHQIGAFQSYDFCGIISENRCKSLIFQMFLCTKLKFNFLGVIIKKNYIELRRNCNENT